MSTPKNDDWVRFCLSGGWLGWGAHGYGWDAVGGALALAMVAYLIHDLRRWTSRYAIKNDTP